MTEAIILAVGGWLSFAGMTAVASVLALILRDRERQVTHPKKSLRVAHDKLDAQWEAKR
jgi:hypothetical protein